MYHGESTKKLLDQIPSNMSNSYEVESNRSVLILPLMSLGVLYKSTSLHLALPVRCEHVYHRTIMRVIERHRAETL